jgi:hypothetical protein
MKVEYKRFGLPFNPRKEKNAKNKISKQIIMILCIFVIIAASLSFAFMVAIRKYITILHINDTLDSVWISSLASYWGGIIGGLFSGCLAFLGVFFTIKYFKASDAKKEKAAIQPFLLVTVGTNNVPGLGFELGPQYDGKNATKEIKVTIANIGNGFGKTLVIHTGFNFGGLAYNKVITVGESESLFFKADPKAIQNGLDIGIQYIDAMRNEYIQEYHITENHGQIDIECGYPRFLEQV